MLPFLPRFFCCYFNFATFALLSNGEQNRSGHFFAFRFPLSRTSGSIVCRSVFCLHLSSLVLLFKILSLLLCYSSIIVNLCFFWVGFKIFFCSFDRSFTSKFCMFLTATVLILLFFFVCFLFVDIRCVMVLDFRDLYLFWIRLGFGWNRSNPAFPS